MLMNRTTQNIGDGRTQPWKASMSTNSFLNECHNVWKLLKMSHFEFFKHCAQGRSWKLKRSFICHAWAYFMASRKTPPKTTSPTLQNAKANFPYSRNCNFWQMIRICRWSAKVNVVTPWRVSAYSNFGIKGLTSLESKMAWHISA